MAASERTDAQRIGAASAATRPLDAHGIGAALAAGELSALYLLDVDPLRSGLPQAQWEAALEKASTVIAHAGFLTEGLRAHASVVFPAESYAEKEGTVVHPDGRLQRLRPAIGRQGETRAGWQVIGDLARRCGHDLGALTAAMASEQLFAAVPFYAGLSLEEIGGRGIRWQERSAADAFPAAPSDRTQTQAAAPSSDSAPTQAAAPPLDSAQTQAERPIPGANGAYLQTPPSLWDSPEVEHSPALKFLFRRGLADAREATVPADAETVAVAAAREGRPA